MDSESARFSKTARVTARTRSRIDAVLAVVTLASILTLLVVGAGCASLGGGGDEDGNGKLIASPFADSQWIDKQSRDRVIFRSKRGSRALEVELPASDQQFADFQVPMSPEFAAVDNGGGRNPASANISLDESYSTRGTTLTDLEILNGMPKGDPAHDAERQQIEQELGLKAVDETAPRSESSYLASIDRVKQLFRGGRYEAALLESDQMLRIYPTDPKLYEMRGTLLDRLGHHELAIRSWQQALKLDPGNASLKMYLDQKTEKANWRKVSSE